MHSQVTYVSRFRKLSAVRFLVTDLDNTIVDSRERFSRAVSEATGYPSIMAQQVSSIKNLTREQRNKFYETFLSGRYMDLDVPVTGSVEALNRLRSKGFGIIYLTGRHHSREESLRNETLRTLSRFGYPMPDRSTVMLFMKPNKTSPTDEFKRRVLERLAASMDLAVGVDDEVNDLRVMVNIVPLVIGVYLSSQARREIVSELNIPLAKDWFEVESIIMKRRIL